jgi:hypothetical protein
VNITDTNVDAAAAVSLGKTVWPITNLNSTPSGSAYTISGSTSKIVRVNYSMSAALTITLPSVASVAGIEVIIEGNGSVSSTNTVTIRPNGSTQTINGLTFAGGGSEVMAHAWSWRRFVSDGSGGWNFDAGVLRSSKNLSDLNSVTTAMTNLSAGSTVSGTAISTTNPILDANAGGVSDRQQGMIIHPWTANTRTLSASETTWVRFTAVRPITIKRMGFRVSTAATNADVVQMGLYGATLANQSSTTKTNWTRLITTGNATLYTSPTNTTATDVTSTGMKYAPFASAATYTLVPGLVYYAAFSYTYASGTGVSVAALSGQMAGAFNTTGGLDEVMNLTGASGATNPADMSSTSLSNGTIGVALVLSTL